MGTEEKVGITLGAVARWRDVEFAVKGFSGDPEASYAKLIIRSGADSRLVTLGLGEVAAVSEGVQVRLDAVPAPSRTTGPPAPTGRGQVDVTVITSGSSTADGAR